MSRFTFISERWKALPPKARRIIPLILVLIFGIWLGNVFFSERPSDHSASHVGSESAVEVWTCSMHPQIRSHEPGNCPICGMALIPVQGGGGHVHGSIEQVAISEHAAALMQVQVRPAERRSVEGSVSVNGRIEFDERQVRDVVVRTEGQIEQLYVNYTLAPVQRGQRLAEVYSPAILAASQEFLSARRSGLTELVDAARSQLQLLGISEEQIAAIETSGEPMRTYTLFSPVGGVITDLEVRQGEWVSAGSRLMRVGSVGQVWVIFDVYESDLRNVRSGQSVRFSVESFPGEAFSGTISFIEPVVDSDRRTARVRVQLANPGGRLRPGMLARGHIEGSASSDAPLIIPRSAPLLTGNRAIVYVQVPGMDSPTYESREVVLGGRTGDYYEITEGLQEGELVVVHGAFRLDSELQIRGGRSMMQTETPSPTDTPSLEHGDRIPLGTVVNAYVELVDALADDNPAGAHRAISSLEQALGNVDADDPAWLRLRGRMNSALSSMHAGEGIEGIREHLPQLSAALEEAVTTLGRDVGTLHRAHCPMAFDFEGADWLQRSETINNPYFGDRMLRCGSITATLSQP